MKNIKIVFMGSPEFSVPTLNLLAKNANVVGVVTQPDRRGGRGKKLISPPIKLAADSLNIPSIQPSRLSKDEAAFQQLKDWDPDVIVVAAFGQILRKKVLELAPFGCINVHASLLPRWRGASPINFAILEGDQKTGITIMEMDAGVDTGDIISQQEINIEPEDTAGSLSEKLSTLGGELLLNALDPYIEGKIKAIPQDDELATYARMMKKTDGYLDPTLSAEALALRVRAFFPWPGSYLEWNEKRLKVHKVIAKDIQKGIVGDRTVIDGFPVIVTSAGSLILEKVQPPGKKAMDGKVFLNGARDWNLKQ